MVSESGLKSCCCAFGGPSLGAGYALFEELWDLVVVAAGGGRVLPRTEDFPGSLVSKQRDKDEKGWDPSLPSPLSQTQSKKMSSPLTGDKVSKKVKEEEAW